MVMTKPSPSQIVFVVDDDAAIRDSLADLFGSVGLSVETFQSAADFLKRAPVDVPSCLVLDVRMPGLSGLEFQEELHKADLQTPIIFMTGYGDIPMTVRAMKAGAIEFMVKPFRDQAMLDAVQNGLERDRERLHRAADFSSVELKFATLTQREKETMRLVTSGLMNKQIAAELNLSEITVKVHRSNVMRKMAVRTVPELVRMADLLGVHEKK
jgi:FixJ family two-component response regulator